jgi:hypothetical protein
MHMRSDKNFRKKRGVKQSHLLYFLPRYPPVHVGVHPEFGAENGRRKKKKLIKNLRGARQSVAQVRARIGNWDGSIDRFVTLLGIRGKKGKKRGAWKNFSSSVHVEEDLEPRVEALIGDLEPEVVELLLGDPLQVLPPPPRQRVEDAHRELLGVHHSCAKKRGAAER